MPDPRSRMKGLPNLGAAIDDRIRETTNRVAIQQSSSAPTVPISHGGFPGGSGQGEEPIVPEAWVVALREASATEALSGSIVIAGGGETTVNQSPIAPHFTITSPVLTATNGVERTGAKFQADASVVRTDGDQSISGVKSFTEFPRTPEADPNLDYEAANKKYVDDRSVSFQLWQRNAGVLSTAHSGDAIELKSYLKSIHTAGSDVVVYSIIGVENHPRYVIQANGSCCWGDGSAFDTVLLRLAPGVLGMEDGHAFRAGEFCESKQLLSEPSMPNQSYSRLYHMDDTRVYSIEPGGAVHDLCVAHKQSFPALAGVDGQQIVLAYSSSAYPPWAVPAPDFVSSGTASFMWAASDGPAQMTDTFAAFEWTSNSQAGGVVAGTQVAIGAACSYYGGKVTLRARVRVNEPARFSALYLSLNDTGSNCASSANFAGSLSADTWYDAVLGGIDTSSWEGCLRLVLTAQGTDIASNVGITQLLVESLSIEQWAK